MADRSSDSGAVYLGLGFAADTERERERGLSEGREKRVGHLIQARGGSGGTELRARGGRATRAVATAPEVEDDPGFAHTPLGLFLFFSSGPNSFDFSVF